MLLVTHLILMSYSLLARSHVIEGATFQYGCITLVLSLASLTLILISLSYHNHTQAD